MRKIEQKLLECFKKRNPFKQGIDKISVDSEKKSIFYYNYESLVFAKIFSSSKEVIYFCLPSFDGVLSSTTKSRVNIFLQEYDLQIQQKNYKCFCHDIEVKLDTIYFIHKNDDGKYFIDGVNYAKV